MNPSLYIREIQKLLFAPSALINFQQCGFTTQNSKKYHIVNNYVKAAKCDDTAAIAQLHFNNCPWDASICAEVAKNGELEVLKWLWAKGCPWDERTSSWAASKGHLNVVRWAHKHNCPWTWMTCALAALGKHTHVLRWAHANGCPWDDCGGCDLAWLGGHIRIDKVLRES